MRASIQTLLNMREASRSTSHLRHLLQWAVELELKTIPPYLCALWSIRVDDNGLPIGDDAAAFLFLRSILREEMGHFGLACNLLNTLDAGSPAIASATSAPRYPGRLPGNIRPRARIALQGLDMRVIRNTFMEIESPDRSSIETYRGQRYHTIGAFYNAILEDFEAYPGLIKGTRQLSFGPQANVEIFEIRNIADVRRAINTIKAQGEGTGASPLGPTGEPAHYFLFGELYYQREITQLNGTWSYSGEPVPFPMHVYPVPEVPRRGYNTTDMNFFDRLYTEVLQALQGAWDQGGAAGTTVLRDVALPKMTDMLLLGRRIMSTPKRTGGGNYCPCFRFRSGPA